MHGRTLALGLALAALSAAAETGTIEGTARLLPREPMEAKATVRYPGQPGAIQPIPKTPIPAVVFVRDDFPGQSFAPPEKHPALTQKNAWFIPEVLAVLVGTTVDFPNLDDQYHNVFSYSKPKRFDLGRYPANETRPVTFDKPGVVKIYCEIHAHMRAWVVVCANPYFAVTDVAGKFRIENVPAGTYRLALWRPQGKELETEVHVAAGQTVPVTFE
jgi:hypothetical protein